MSRAVYVSHSLVVLCGLPFSGKSTLGRMLASRISAVHLELDRIVASQGIDLHSRSVPRAAWIAAYREGHAHLDALLANGRSVIWDAVSYRWSHREKLRRVASQHDASMYLIWLDVPAHEIDRRRAENRIRPVRGDVQDADFTMVINGFQPPRADELTLRYDPETTSLESVIDQLAGMTISSWREPRLRHGIRRTT